MPVDDPTDPRIAGYRQIRERDLAGREGVFVAEGEVVVRRLAASRFETLSLLIADKRVAGFADLVAALPDETPVFAASQSVMDAIVGFPIHRGVLALGRRPTTAGAATALAGLPSRALVVALFGIANHDNMGGLFRNAAAFGADLVLLGADCCDPLYRKAIRVSVGGVLELPFATLAPGEDAVALLRNAGFEVLSLSPSGQTRLADVRAGPRTAVLFGAEGPGLPAQVLARTRTVSIPMSRGFDSLNVATTSGIVLHHLRS